MTSMMPVSKVAMKLVPEERFVVLSLVHIFFGPVQLGFTERNCLTEQRDVRVWGGVFIEYQERPTGSEGEKHHASKAAWRGNSL